MFLVLPPLSSHFCLPLERDRRERTSSEFIKIANDRLTLHRALYERRAASRWKKRFKKTPIKLTKRATDQADVLGMQRWVIDPSENAFILVDSAACTGSAFPIVWWDETTDSDWGDREARFKHDAGPFKPLRNVRFRTWTDYLGSRTGSLYDGPIAAVHAIKPDADFSDPGFVEIRASSYFAYVNTGIVLGVVESYRTTRWDLPDQVGRWSRITIGCRHPRLSWTLWKTNPLKFKKRSASVGLSVALLIEECTSAESGAPRRFRLLLHERGQGVATAPGRTHVVPAGELSLGASKDCERSDRKIPMPKYVYMSFVKELTEELYSPSPSLSPSTIAVHPLRTGDQDHTRELPREWLDGYTTAAVEAEIELALVGFMLDSLNLKGELLAMSVVTLAQLNDFGSRCDLVFKDPSEEGSVLHSGRDGELGIPVDSVGGIPHDVFDYPLTPAARVLLDRVHKWLLNGCKSGP